MGVFCLKRNDFTEFTFVLCDTSVCILISCCCYDVIWKNPDSRDCVCRWCPTRLVKHSWLLGSKALPLIWGCAFVISTFLFGGTCLTLSKSYYTGPIILSAVSARGFYSLIYITEHLSGKKKKRSVFLDFPSLSGIIGFGNRFSCTLMVIVKRS